MHWLAGFLCAQSATMNIRGAGCGVLLLLGLLSSPVSSFATTSMGNEQAAALLDYRMNDKVESAMRARLQDNPEDGHAWHYLSLSLRAQGKLKEAEAARSKAEEYGHGARNWSMDLRLSGFVDSNVVIAPNALNLAARDRGDIGARLNALLAGKTLDYGWTHTAWSLAYADMLYQDFNSFTLRQLQAGLAQHIDLSDAVDVWAGVHAEQASLGGKKLLIGWNTVGGSSWQLNDNHALKLDLSLGHRNFQSGFDAFTAWRWKAAPAWSWQGDGLQTKLASHIASEQTHSGEEAYRQIGAGATGGWRVLDKIGHGAVWLEGTAGMNLRNYQQINRQPFLVRAIKRRDTQIKLAGSLAWKRSQSLWSEKASETWKFQGGWMRNRSNIDRGAVFDVAQTRDWRRWWTDVSVQWHY